jgi:hypothetical protein
MNTEQYRLLAKVYLVMTKLFAVAVLFGRVTSAGPAFRIWNSILVIVFSFLTTYAWIATSTGQDVKQRTTG